MAKLSTGQESELGVYRDLSAAVFGESSPATKYLDDKISKAPNGRAEKVIADESQMVMLLVSMHNGAK